MSTESIRASWVAFDENSMFDDEVGASHFLRWRVDKTTRELCPKALQQYTAQREM